MSFSSRMWLSTLVATFVLSYWSPANGAEITYSWSGTMRLYDDAQPDPWGIGTDGAEFTLSVTVDMSASDLQPTQTPFATFLGTSARLWLDGDQITYAGSAETYFTDFSSVPEFDTITMWGDFTKDGETVTVGSLVGLAPTTFTFIEPSGAPPFFAPTQTSGLSRDLSRPYATTVETGSVVTVVPEPQTLTLLTMLSAVVLRCLPGSRV